jgi:hypothetical protein
MAAAISSSFIPENSVASERTGNTAAASVAAMRLTDNLTGRPLILAER